MHRRLTARACTAVDLGHSIYEIWRNHGSCITTIGPPMCVGLPKADKSEDSMQHEPLSFPGEAAPKKRQGRTCSYRRSRDFCKRDLRAVIQGRAVEFSALFPSMRTLQPASLEGCWHGLINHSAKVSPELYPTFVGVENENGDEIRKYSWALPVHKG